MSGILDYLVTRMKEPSTWVSLGSMLTAIGFAVRPDLWQQISAVAMGIGGVLGVILSEKKSS
jgi:hypothetical protein